LVTAAHLEQRHGLRPGGEWRALHSSARIRPRTIAFNAQHPRPKLIVIAKLSAEERASDLRSRSTKRRKFHMRIAVARAAKPAQIEAGQGSRNRGRVASRSVSFFIRVELISDATGSAKAFETRSIPIVQPQITKPARIHKVAGNAERVLPKG